MPVSSAQHLSASLQNLLSDGTVIPAHPLAVDESRKLDSRMQRAITRYYLDAGAGGVAVGVHTTQFAIRQKGLYEPVLRLAMETVEQARLKRPFLKVAGVAGPTSAAVKEAELAREIGYDMALVAPFGGDRSESSVLEKIRAVAQVMPVFAFYLQPSVGGMRFSYDFWAEVATIRGLVAIKVAPFNRYQTIEVMRAVADSDRHEDIALYTGNDDNIIGDLLIRFETVRGEEKVRKSFVGGLLGQWAVWTKAAVRTLETIKKARNTGGGDAQVLELLCLSSDLTDANSAIFDARNDFKGSIAGTNEILRRQGLMQNRLTLEPNEDLSPGQAGEIDRVVREHPSLHSLDDEFIEQNLNYWLG